MPRYYFHVRRGGVTMRDLDGLELADIAEAEAEAARRGRKIAAHEASQGIRPTAALIIIDEGWRTVLELPIEKDQG